MTLLFLWGCNSQFADLSPLSKRKPFITQLGKFTKSPNGNNLGNEICSSIVLDEKFETSFCIGSTTGSPGKVSDGSQDILITKFNRSGKLLWVKQFSSSNSADESCTSAGIDQNGNVYCGGSTTGMMESVPERYDTSTARVLTDDDKDAFVLKIDRDGNLLWVKQFGTTKDDKCANIAVSPVGNVYCGSATTGVLGEEVSGGLETHNEVLDAGGNDQNTDAFIAKLASSGQVLWIRQIGANAYPDEADFADTCGGITIDQDENVTCGGNTEGSLAETNAGGGDLILWSLTKDGNFRFLKQIGEESEASSNVILNTAYVEQGFDVAADSRGNLYFVGLTTGDLVYSNLDFKQDAFIFKFDRDGNILDGAQASFTGHQSGQAVIVDKNEEVYLLGMSSTSAYGPVGGSADIFVVKLGQNLYYEWMNQFGSDSGLDSSGTEAATGLRMDQAGNIYIGGYTTGNLGETNASSNYDMFMLRMSNDGFFNKPPETL